MSEENTLRTKINNAVEKVLKEEGDKIGVTTGDIEPLQLVEWDKLIDALTVLSEELIKQNTPCEHAFDHDIGINLECVKCGVNASKIPEKELEKYGLDKCEYCKKVSLVGRGENFEFVEKDSKWRCWRCSPNYDKNAEVWK